MKAPAYASDEVYQELAHCLCESPSPIFVESLETLMTAAKHYDNVGD
jgi:hypothetical protein